MKSTEYKYTTTWLRPRSKNLYQIMLEHQQKDVFNEQILTASCLQTPAKYQKDESQFEIINQINSFQQISNLDIERLINPLHLFESSISEIQMNESVNNLVNYQKKEISQELNKYLTNLSIVNFITKYRILDSGFAFIIRLQQNQSVQIILNQNSELKFAIRHQYHNIVCESTHSQRILKPNTLNIIKNQVTIENVGDLSIPICFYIHS
ncbi:unnamed protein product (macronuclear) [Paramecium tetraurelia]|uniref:Uncharacterized protein n=1 Tax=Paramecium tetraurelia TaxID=5888 RepID=A0E0W0_PARTE|nr:uncharacterized protein GSPATT00022095001 [Paramecium tetraurelia]CAK88927.1 unnamed protein product [Paramecium tetraurelia]|eukprot:XP_001456324.1 hypothetical protein (macronuclear) [Paramecium tetraurelia strain d4-2]